MDKKKILLVAAVAVAAVLLLKKKQPATTVVEPSPVEGYTNAAASFAERLDGVAQNAINNATNQVVTLGNSISTWADNAARRRQARTDAAFGLLRY